MESKDILTISYWPYRYGKPYRSYPSKKSLLKAFQQTPLVHRKGLKIKTHIKLSLDQ